MTQAESLTGVPKRTLATWVARGVCKPTTDKGYGRSNGKHWSFSDLVGLRVISDLRDQGISLQRVRKVITSLRGLTSRGNDLQALASAKLVITGRNDVSIVTSKKALVSVLSGQQLLPGIVVADLEPSLRDVQQRMQRAVRRDKTLQTSIDSLKQQRAWILEGGQKAA